METCLLSSVCVKAILIERGWESDDETFTILADCIQCNRPTVTDNERIPCRPTVSVRRAFCSRTFAFIRAHPGVPNIRGGCLLSTQ